MQIYVYKRLREYSPLIVCTEVENRLCHNRTHLPTPLQEWQVMNLPKRVSFLVFY